MLRHGFIPDIDIVTLHKGSNKRKDNSDIYQAIYLASVEFKLFEIVSFKRCLNDTFETINVQQGDFQDGLDV